MQGQMQHESAVKWAAVSKALPWSGSCGGAVEADLMRGDVPGSWQRGELAEVGYAGGCFWAALGCWLE